MEKFAKANKENVCYGYFEKSGHNNFTDSGFNMAREHSGVKNLAAVDINTKMYDNH